MSIIELSMLEVGQSVDIMDEDMSDIELMSLDILDIDKSMEEDMSDIELISLDIEESIIEDDMQSVIIDDDDISLDIISLELELSCEKPGTVAATILPASTSPATKTSCFFI